MKAVVLLGFAEALSAPEVVWSLVDGGFKPVVFSRRGRQAAVNHSRYATVHEITPPESDAKGTVAELTALLASLRSSAAGRPVVLLPLDDAAVWVSSRISLPTGCVLAGPKDELAALALDKSVQLAAAEKAGFRVLPTQLARTPGDVLSREQSFPVMMKSAYAVLDEGERLGKGRFWICDTKVELERAVKQWAGGTVVLIQPYVTGVGEGVFGLAGTGGVQCWSAHRRLRMMNPHGSGSSAAVSQEVPAEVGQPAGQFIRQAGWKGIFMIELLRDSSGGVWFMEFNGRSWGSMALSRRQGLEYPAWNVELALDADFRVPTRSLDGGAVVCRNLGRELMHLLFVLRGPKSKAVKEWPSFWKTLFGMVRFGRRDCLYNWRRDDAGVFLRDTYYTLRNGVIKKRS